MADRRNLVTGGEPVVPASKMAGESLRYFEHEQQRNALRVAALTLRGTGGRTTSRPAPAPKAVR